MTRTRGAGILNLVVALVLLGAFTGCVDGDRSDPAARAPSAVLRGSFDVYYDLQLSETEGRASGNKPLKVSAIHFHSEYIVIEHEGHGGRVIPIRQIKDFRWH